MFTGQLLGLIKGPAGASNAASGPACCGADDQLPGRPSCRARVCIACARTDWCPRNSRGTPWHVIRCLSCGNGRGRTHSNSPGTERR